MTEEQRKQVAVFRFGVIHEFTGSTRLDPGETEALLREKCARKWEIPFTTRTRISRSTIVRWVSVYLAHGKKLEALYPRGRNDAGQPRALDEETGLALLALRRERPKVPITELLHLLSQRQESAGLGKGPSLSTVYRFLHQHGLMRGAWSAQEDRRKFEAELPNDLWQSDVMHGPLVRMGDKQRKSYLIAFLDDHSRLVTHGAFYPSEGLGPFLEAFSRALLKRGLPRKLYVDNGSAYTSKEIVSVCARLGILLSHAPVRDGAAKGKIERFFRSVRERFLSRRLDLSSLEKLNRQFCVWVEERYTPARTRRWA
ncbi:MAG: transposase [Proteobacteria bacterium]|nr:transposase [Pseudomonadota bacterium]